MSAQPGSRMRAMFSLNFAGWYWFNPMVWTLPKAILLFALLCLIYPPAAQAPGAVLDITLTGVSDRFRIASELFWTRITQACSSFGENMWLAFDSFVTASPIWQLPGSPQQGNLTLTWVPPAYPVGKAVAYFLLGATSINIVGHLQSFN